MRQLIGEIFTILIVFGLIGVAVLAIAAIALIVLVVLAIVTGREKGGAQTPREVDDAAAQRGGHAVPEP
ncbi:hypothetical protein [Planobispora longispora]|uniref:Uncharacterized protein n=1 Tax=Planobispora longispora TaxID=28887 RepID=A0A8J3RSH3_9ACTN|nr:hypothetical protein [Planobispora longispora]GIH80288.1 hypothetical protein Plo01_67170 [Planobispora longispora]